MKIATDLKTGAEIKDYEDYASLRASVNAFINETRDYVKSLQDRKIWMVNSTRRGGGVAEMLPRIISIMRQSGLNVDWAIIESDKPEFFSLTKRIHNMIHGQAAGSLKEEERAIMDEVNAANANEFLEKVNDGDVVIVHDPQPLPMAQILKSKKDIRIIWRCHIGLDKTNEYTREAWQFLQPYLKYYDHFIFSAPEYVPEFISGNVSVIYPGIDPLSHKNRYLNIHKLTGILCNAGILPYTHPVVGDFFQASAKRINGDGSWSDPTDFANIDIFYRPVITQISRWDRLKGFQPLLEGFAHLKQNINKYAEQGSRHERSIKYSRLILAGPDPSFVADDPEGLEVLQELTDFYKSLPENIKEDIVMLLLPMASEKENALIVNAIQNLSSIVVQNSLQEGFGLTLTEAMWKLKPVVAGNACGLRQQIRNGVEGSIVKNPDDKEQIANALSNQFQNQKNLEKKAFNAQNRIINKFLIFTQITNWLEVINHVCFSKQG